MWGRTPLQEAAENGALDLVQNLLGDRADVNALAAYGHGIIALQGATIRGFTRIALVLLEFGANINAALAVCNGRSALEGASEHGHLDMLQLPLNARGQIDALEIKMRKSG